MVVQISDDALRSSLQPIGRVAWKFVGIDHFEQIAHQSLDLSGHLHLTTDPIALLLEDLGVLASLPLGYRVSKVARTRSFESAEPIHCWSR